MRQWEIGHKCVKLCKVGRFKLKNIWASDKSWEPGSRSHSLSYSLSHHLFSCLCSIFVLMSMLKSHCHNLSLFHSLICSLSICWKIFVFMSMLKSHSHTLSLFHSLNQYLWLSICWTTFDFMSMLKSQSDTLSLSHHLQTCTLSCTHSGHAEQLLYSCLGSKVAV